ncbi:RHS repeat-associated core domain-containing protein [Actinocorallia longicatena]|uniref:RHS repeat-associated core domain-containing protein n=1 Tax=Actinocorallia longicatena TaxID=111803 RepID=A0ABP6QIH9_9ACTN
MPIRRVTARPALLLAMAPLLAIPLFGQIPAIAAAADRLQAQIDPEVPGATVKPVRTPPGRTGTPFKGAEPVWPGGGDAVVALSGDRQVAAGALPVTVAAGKRPDGRSVAGTAAPEKVRVEVLDRRAGGGPVLRISRADGVDARGSVRVSVDYAKFRDAYGADWSTRLRLVQDGSRVLPTTNDQDQKTVTADVEVAPPGPATGVAAAGTLVAVQAAPSGPSGDYSATSLQPSSAWTSGGSSGDFTWNYPLRLPPSPGPVPKVSLGYSSQSVDGRMVSSNNQPSMIGEGFDWSPGYLERKYKSCTDDMSGGNNSTKTGDQCWATDNATLSFNGKGGELIFETGKGWHLRNDDGTRIERRTGGVNGDNDGEHWVVTTTDGTQYWFGRNRLPGWASGKAETGSVLTSPVYGNHAGEPCHAAAFSGSSCAQAYRWNLDYVVDAFGNSSSYWYAKETGKYGRNGSSTDLASYDRAGYLTRIDYGTRSDTAYGTAPAQVVFDMADRCLANCTSKTATSWPDVPWDQECTASPCYTGAPTFWTTKRLAKVTTRIWNGTAPAPVESWTLTHSFPDPGDGTRAGLWLDRISHSGLTGGTASVPDVSFTGVQMPNRVDATDHSPAMNWWRLAQISTETGGKISVAYSGPDCVAASRIPSAPESNKLRCYPVKWTPPGLTDPVTDYFHKYVVTAVTENDLTGGAPRTVTAYEYVGDPAWHYTDDDGLVKADSKTWSVWRGYGTVRTRKGDPGEQTLSEARYFRGMHGDKLPTGTRAVTLPAAGGAPAVEDEDAYAGMTRQSTVLNGAAEVSGEVTEPWRSAPSASRTINGVAVHARFTGTAATHGRTVLDGGKVRTTTVRNTLDAYGMVTQVDDAGDEDAPGDESCVKTTFEPRNTARWLVSYAHRTETYAVPCGTAPASEKDVIGDERTSYDGQAHGTAPVNGAKTVTEVLKTWTPTARTYLVSSKAVYDVQGRVVEARDVKDNKTVTAYTPATGGPVTASTVTSPLGWKTTTTLAPSWGLPTKIVDNNGRTTELAYDPLGRLTSVWLPGRARSESASATYAYRVRNDGPVAVTTSKLNAAGGYTTFHTLYDGLLRPRQSQAPEAGTLGGRIITDTLYDTAGRTWKTNEAYVADGAPVTDLFQPCLGRPQPCDPDAQIPAQTRKTYDGAGRETASAFLVKGREKWRTTTVHGGDHKDVTPPAGGTPTTIYTDARGLMTEQRQYKGDTAAGDFDATTYSYTRKGELEKITDPAGNTWTNGYDLRGRNVTVADPDKGTTTSAYNDAGELVSVTDTDDQKLIYAYDAIGRRKELYAGSVAPANKRAEWTFDTVVTGQPSASTRYEGGNAYTRAVTAYTTDYKPKTVTYTIPEAETGLAGTYTYEHTFTGNGLPATTKLPDLDGTGGLPAETLTQGYTALDKPRTLSTSIGATTYVDSTSYTRFGELAVFGRRNAGGRFMDTGLYYQEGTRRLERILTTKETAPAAVTDLNLTYDATGNVTRLADTPAAGVPDVQCFTYDHLRRLTEAWTPGGGDCDPDPSAAALGGPAKYWHTWSFDLVGNRTKLVEHATATGDVTTAYRYPAPKASQPHTLLGTTRTDSAGAVNAAYTYDDQGNTLTRPAPTSGDQTLTWDVEGHLATSRDTTGTSGNLYDADGDRLIHRDPGGKTLYLPDQELRTTTAGIKTSTRYYTHSGQQVAVRTSTGLTWLASDHQGTQTASAHPVTQAVSRRRQLPYGDARGTTAAWPSGMDKGFVGGTNDSTGLTHLGAREYDARIGRFISVDPVIDPNDPQQLHGYGYSVANPITMSDPDGRLPGWMKAVGSLVKNQVEAHVEAAKTAVAAVGNAVSTVGSVLYEQAGNISAVSGVLAMVTPPPLNLVLGGISLVAGAVDAYKSCSEGKPLECGLGVVSLVPGVAGLRAGSKVYKARDALKLADKLAGEAQDGIKLAKVGYDEALMKNPFYAESRKAYDQSMKSFEATLDQVYQVRSQALTTLNKWVPIDKQWTKVGNVFTWENWGFTNLKWNGMADSRDELYLGHRPQPVVRASPPRPQPTGGWNPYRRYGGQLLE